MQFFAVNIYLISQDVILPLKQTNKQTNKQKKILYEPVNEA